MADNEKWSAGGVGIGCGIVALAIAIAIVGTAWALSWQVVELERTKHRPLIEEKP